MQQVKLGNGKGWGVYKCGLLFGIWDYEVQHNHCSTINHTITTLLNHHLVKETEIWSLTDCTAS